MEGKEVTKMLDVINFVIWLINPLLVVMCSTMMVFKLFNYDNNKKYIISNILNPGLMK